MGSSTSLIRNLNRSSILEYVRDQGCVSRTQIERDLKISLPTVMRIVDILIDEQLLKHGDLQASTGGRPSAQVEFNGEAFAVAGIDLGGTKLYGAIASLSGNIQSTMYREHSDTGATTPEEFVESLCDFIEELLAIPRPDGQQMRGIGIGAPGITLVPEGIVKFAPSFNWHNLPLQQILRDRFSMPVTVENDVNLAALGEWGYGAAKGSQSSITLAIGTGIGAGIILENAIFRGFTQSAGEVGYMLPSIRVLGQQFDDGFGALESIASGNGIAARAQQLLRQNNIPFEEGHVSGRYVFEQARKDVAWACQVVAETIDYLALLIANVSVILDPEVIVLGGGVGRDADMLITPIKARLANVIPTIPRIVGSTLNRDATVMGAVVHVMNATSPTMIVKQLT